MTQIGAFEAKNSLSDLLERAERGEEITITKRGRPVAKLVPVDSPADRSGAVEAVRLLRAEAEARGKIGLTWMDLKALRDEGRP